MTEQRMSRIVTNDPDPVVSPDGRDESSSVMLLPLDSLVIEGSPRSAGADPNHIRLLAESTDVLPPIIVHRPTMRVIDGVHRVRAATLNGRREILARLLDCDENAAFVLAVKANVTHGLPLSQADRAAAAARIIQHNPYWSDRAVAAAAGLSDKTVSRIRACSSAELPHSNNARLGRDGRVRPMDVGTRRQQAAAMIVDRPDAGLREVARATGLSAATVRDVRQRIHRGDDPVPDRYRSPTGVGAPPPVTCRRVEGGPRPRPERPAADRSTLLANLRLDPSLRFSEAGRGALRWLSQHIVDTEGLETVNRTVPDHCAPVVASLARSCATAWIGLAERLERRIT